MSCVTSHEFTKEYGKAYPAGKSQVNAKTYGLDNQFFIEAEDHNICQGTVRVTVPLNVEDAKVLKKQLEEFISQNT